MEDERVASDVMQAVRRSSDAFDSVLGNGGRLGTGKQVDFNCQRRRLRGTFDTSQETSLQ